MELHFLKITWGDIIILKSDDEVALVDTGYDGNFNEISDYLDKLNAKKISFILLTHFHRDHYGSIAQIVKKYDVEKVYFKDYSGLDKTTAWGTIADDNYRNNEMKKCLEIKKIILENSNLIQTENIKTIKFGDTELELYNNDNSIKKIYEDDNYKDSYHKILFSENQNSLAIFMKVNGINVFLGGDIFDREAIHPKANYVNYQIASSIKEKIDIYKVPHHGTINCNSDKALEIYKPKIAVITNEDEYLKNNSTIYDDLKRANKDAVKERMLQAINSTVGTAEAVASIPMTIVDGSEGIAMASNARSSLKNGINQQAKKKEKGIYDKTSKKYTGKNKNLKAWRDSAIKSGINVATLGMYGNIKNNSALNKDHNKKIQKAINNTQHEIAIRQLEKNINEQYDKLISNPNIDRNELEEVIKSANKTVPKEAIEKVVYRISAMQQIEVNVKGEISSNNDSILPQERQQTKQSNKKSHEKSKNIIDSGLDKEISEMLNSTKKVKNATNKIQKSLKFDKKDIKFNEEKFNKSIKHQLAEIIAKEDNVKKSEITDNQLKMKFENLDNEQKEKIAKNALYSSIKLSKNNKDILKKTKTKIGLKEANNVIDKLSQEKNISIETNNFKDNFKETIIEEVSNKTKKNKQDIKNNELDEYISNLSNEDFIQKMREVGSKENSIKRHRSATKQEYAELIKNIEKLRYHKEQMKG